jgi:hypothetical protein
VSHEPKLPPLRRKRKGILDILFFSWANNVWFGIGTLVAIFVYSSLGSAIPSLRQHHLLEMTEMAWFHWWPFDVLIALLCINNIVVTIKQIPLRMVNAGVWMIHTGIIILALGSVYYFSTKLEGDAPVFRRQTMIRVPGQAKPASLLIRPNSHTSIGDAPDEYHFAVSQIIPDWVIASGQDKGKRAPMIWIDCVTPKQRFTRQLLIGYPQYTEDILPDRTRAKKTLGKPLVDDTLDISLDYMPQDEFFLQNTFALYTRPVGSDRWLERPIKGMPRYHDRISSYDQVFLDPVDADMPLRPIDIAVDPAVEGEDPLADYDVRVLSYLRYAHMSTRWQDGGPTVNPVARVALRAGDSSGMDYELVAFDPARSRVAEGQVVFRWVETRDALDDMVASASGSLVFSPRGSKGKIVVSLDDVPQRGDSAPFRPIAGADLKFRVKSVMHNFVVQSGEFAGHSMSVATVEIQTGGRRITRFVTDVPGTARDLAGNGSMQQPDPVVSVVFRPGIDARVTLVSGPNDVPTQVVVKSLDGTIARHPIGPGQTVPITPEITLTLDSLLINAVEESRPRVVPLAQRDRGARVYYSKILVQMSKGDWSEERWLVFNNYALPNEQYAVPRRMVYSPLTMTLDNGQRVELLYSRERRPLPAPIALESFTLETHDGGYTGGTETVRDFVSQLRFQTDDGWSDQMQMSSNNPASWGGYWYFQSTWDPPSQGYAGMNYTGLGVGNRNGVYIQLFGTCVAVAGMLFAFYAKPAIRRRMQDRAAAERDGRVSTPAVHAERETELISS